MRTTWSRLVSPETVVAGVIALLLLAYLVYTLLRPEKF
ncbi:MAG TPA: K(+)-transporting ATPase subunit F [Gemmatimonadales bacterium]|nr:K(+)-transporting ATPase subunit F [Gemmatimonadales bacterium]